MLSKKEFVAIFLLIIGLLCILNAAAFGKIVPTTTSYVQLTQQIVSSSTAYICVMYALSTWLFHSNYSEPRQHIRIVFLGMLLIMIAAHITVLVLTFRPRCPRCWRRLILHEDIIPFLSEGPYTCPDNGVVLAQPRNVPRPTGMYLQIYQYPSWFGVNTSQDYLGYERNLSMIVDAIRVCIEASNLQGQMPRVLTTDDELLSGLK
ncbi:hypothetical protein ACLKA7_009614 [Drosophila subpalustris]